MERSDENSERPEAGSFKDLSIQRKVLQQDIVDRQERLYQIENDMVAEIEKYLVDIPGRFLLSEFKLNFPGANFNVSSRHGIYQTEVTPTHVVVRHCEINFINIKDDDILSYFLDIQQFMRIHGGNMKLAEGNLKVMQHCSVDVTIPFKDI